MKANLCSPRLTCGARRAIMVVALIRAVSIPAALAAVALIPAAAVAKPATNASQVNARQTTADSFTNTFASLGSTGWLGGDGTLSVALPRGRVAWLFSDTATAPSVGGQLNWVHNSIVLTHPNARPRVIANPIPPQPDGSYFWVQSARLTGGQIWVLCARVINVGSGLWDFNETDTWLAKLDANTFHLVSFRAVPDTGEETKWGAGLFDRGAYTYIYGLEGAGSGLSSRTYLHVARVPRGRLDQPWAYYTGAGYSPDQDASSRLRVDATSTFSSVSLLDLGSSGIRMISQLGIFSPVVYSWRAVSPTGPFTAPRKIYDTSTQWNTRVFKDTYTYMTLAHPDQTDAATMLFSFCVNSFKMLSRSTVAQYRPRFFRLPIASL